MRQAERTESMFAASARSRVLRALAMATNAAQTADAMLPITRGEAHAHAEALSLSLHVLAATLSDAAALLKEDR